MRFRKNIYNKKAYLPKIILAIGIISLLTIILELGKDSSPEITRISKEIRLDHDKIER